MLSPWHKLVITRASRTRGETRWLIRVARKALRESSASNNYRYSRIRSWRLSAAEVLIVRTCYAPWLVPVAVGVCLGYLAIAVYVAYRHVR